MMNRTTPLGAVVSGLFAGAVATGAMDLAMYGKYRAGGGKDRFIHWEFGGPNDWDSVSAPGQVGRRLYEGFTQRELASRWARLTNNVMHWGYGIAWGSLFGVLAGSARRSRPLVGPAFGAAVWASSYVTLPIAGLYKPIWEYRPSELAPDLAAHIVYGTTTERAFHRLLSSG